MFKVNDFNSLIAKKGLTKEKVASKLGIANSTLHRKMNRSGDFSKDEIIKLINIFGKESIVDLFFN